MMRSGDDGTGPVTSFGLPGTPLEVARSGVRFSALGGVILVLFGLGGVLFGVTSSEPWLALVPGVLLLAGTVWLLSAARRYQTSRRMRKRQPLG
jgi:hypothetical protein